MELYFDSGSDSDFEKKVSAHSAFAGAAFIFVRIFYRFRNVVHFIYPCKFLHNPVDFVFAGVVILGFGIALSVTANVIMNAGEAFVKVVADTSKKKFGNVKIAFDISNVLMSVLLSLILFDFTVVGAREGTLIAAVGTGLVVKFFTPLLKPINRYLSK